MNIGLMELVVVFVVALIVIGPDKLPTYAKKLGVALREFRKASEDLTKDFQENVVVPLDEAQRPLREAIEPLQELEKGVRSDIRGWSPPCAASASRRRRPQPRRLPRRRRRRHPGRMSRCRQRRPPCRRNRPRRRMGSPVRQRQSLLPRRPRRPGRR